MHRRQFGAKRSTNPFDTDDDSSDFFHDATDTWSQLSGSIDDHGRKSLIFMPSRAVNLISVVPCSGAQMSVF